MTPNKIPTRIPVKTYYDGKMKGSYTYTTTILHLRRYPQTISDGLKFTVYKRRRVGQGFEKGKK